MPFVVVMSCFKSNALGYRVGYRLSKEIYAATKMLYNDNVDNV